MHRSHPLTAVLLLVAIAPLARAAATQDLLFEEEKLVPFDGVAQDWYGYDVAVDGDTLIIGAHQDDDTQSSAGAAYVYVRSNDTWSFQQKLVADDAAQNAYFGRSVDLEGDTAIIGADGVAAAQGAAYFFTRSGSTWTQQQKIEAPDAQFNEWFGYSVALSGDSLVVGAWQDDEPMVSNSGSAYVFVRSGMTWTFEARLVADAPVASDYFGSAVAISGDVVVAGARLRDDVGLASGAAYVYERTGTTWSLVQQLLGSDTATQDQFGNRVSIDGDTILIAAPFDTDAFSLQGSAYVFERSGSTWVEQAKLLPDDAAAQDEFGADVWIRGDLAIIGSRFDEGSSGEIDAGSAYVFQREAGAWTQRLKLAASAPGISDRLGFAVCATDEWGLVGAHQRNEQGSDSGVAYVFRLNNEFCGGVGCPCGNDDATAGCVNSTGRGGKLQAPLQSSIAADSLVLSASDLPPFNLGLVVATDTVLGAPVQVGDGSLCVGGGSSFRFTPSIVDGEGTLSVSKVVSSAPLGFFVPGEFRYFQAWSRDVFCSPLPMPCPSPCGGGSNVSNAVDVFFNP